MFDYGLDMFACLWIAVDFDGRCYVYREVQQSGLIVSAAAALMNSLTPPTERIEFTIAPPDMWNRQKDSGRTMEFMGEYYGTRFVQIANPYDTDKLVISFDFSILKKLPFQIKLDVGNSSYWSEIASQQTLDNLLMNKRISTVEYLKRLPAGSITDRESLIKIMQQTQTLPDGTIPDSPLLGGAGAEQPPSPDSGIPVIGGRGNHELQRKINETGTVPQAM